MTLQNKTLSAALIVVLGVLWNSLVFLAPISVGWRDSGEFLLSPFFLDITHSAGFPLYSQMANVFALLPMGPIGWRVHLFAAFTGILFLGSTFWCTWLSLAGIRSLNPKVRFLLSLLTTPLVLSSYVFWKGVLSAEAYLLNGTFVLLSICGLILYINKRDLRILYTMAFFGGVACGNHIAFAVTGVCAVPALLLSRIPLRSFLFAAIFGVVGLGVYGYLPARALAHPPLNTGAPETTERFINQVTNARDSALRPRLPFSGGAATSSLLIFARDLRKLCQELPAGAVVFAGFGAISLARLFPVLCLCHVGVLAGSLFFFAGWDPDPWAAAFATLVCLAVYGVLALYTIMQRNFPKLGSVSVACLCMTCVLTPTWQKLPETIIKGSRYAAPSGIGRNILSSVPRHRPLVTEPSWFLLRYVTAVEGYRDDVLLAYQPQILFSNLFAPVLLETVDGERFTSATNNTVDEPNLSAAGTFIGLASKSGPIYLETTATFTEPFKGLIQKIRGLLPRLVKGQQGFMDPEFVQFRSAFLEFVRKSNANAGPLFYADGQNYLEVMLAREVELVTPQESLLLYRSVCENSICSSRITNNYGLALLESGFPCEAKQLFQKIRTPTSSATDIAIRRNRLLANTRCPQ